MNTKVILISVVSVIIIVTVTLVLVLNKKSDSNNNNNGGKVTLSWSVQDSGVCSKPCGSGSRYVKYSCVGTNSSGTSVSAPPNQCIAELGPDPSGEVPCNTDPCQWTAGPWSSCSTPCGPGTQTRTVNCENGNAPNSVCSGAEPPSSQSCEGPPCEWQVGAWGNCMVNGQAVTCGKDATRTRIVACPVEGQCNSSQPSSVDTCQGDIHPPDTTGLNIGYCNWGLGSWGPDCNSTYVCGTGPQSRNVSCPRNAENCDPNVNHTSSQVCNTNSICSWNASSKQYPYPFPSEESFATFNDAPIHLLLSNNQYYGLDTSTQGKIVISENPSVIGSSVQNLSTGQYELGFILTGLLILCLIPNPNNPNEYILTGNQVNSNNIVLVARYSNDIQDYYLCSNTGMNLKLSRYDNTGVYMVQTTNPQSTDFIWAKSQ
jgi:hypothetical protein